MAKVGRPPFKPTAAMRRQVEELRSCGMSEDSIARVIGISTPTLQKHFAEELLNGSAKKRAEVLAQYGRPEGEKGWHFLVGDEKAIEAITAAVGYGYFYNERTQQYGHPAAIVFLTPQGMVARYLYGLNFNPTDIRLALLEASEGRSISTAEQIILYCYAYDPAANSYALIAVRVMQLGGAVTLLTLCGFLVLFWRRERRRGRSGSVPAVTGGPNKA